MIVKGHYCIHCLLLLYSDGRYVAYVAKCFENGNLRSTTK